MSQDHTKYVESIYLLVFQTQSRVDEPANAVEQQVRALLRGDIAGFVLGVIITVIGLSALTIHLLRARSQNRLLLWFGVVTGLYGVRLLASTETIHLLVDATPVLWRYVQSGISYVILIPCLLYAQGLYGRGWQSSLRWLIWVQTIYAAAAIIVNLTQADPSKAPIPCLWCLLLF
jgi:type IV secretory pathway VirB2 component (pilin)